MKQSLPHTHTHTRERPNFQMFDGCPPNSSIGRNCCRFFLISTLVSIYALNNRSVRSFIPFCHLFTAALCSLRCVSERMRKSEWMRRATWWYRFDTHFSAFNVFLYRPKMSLSIDIASRSNLITMTLIIMIFIGLNPTDTYSLFIEC